MKNPTLITLIVALGLIISPMGAMADSKHDKHHKGTPHALNNILDEVSNINDKIDGLDADNDNPLLSDILTEVQGLRSDIGAMDHGGGASIHGAQQSEGLIVDPANGSVHDLVSITGSGSFVAARMTKQGGTNHITSVQLIIDGKTIVGRTYAALDNWGMTQNNPYGVVLLHGNGVDAVTIGFQQPIKFNNSLVLRTTVGEPGIVQMIGTVIYGQ